MAAIDTEKNEVLGSISAIFGNDKSCFGVEEVYGLDILDYAPKGCSRKKVVEISRFCVRPDFKNGKIANGLATGIGISIYESNFLFVCFSVEKSTYSFLKKGIYPTSLVCEEEIKNKEIAFDKKKYGFFYKQKPSPILVTIDEASPKTIFFEK